MQARALTSPCIVRGLKPRVLWRQMRRICISAVYKIHRVQSQRCCMIICLLTGSLRRLSSNTSVAALR